ncbi:WAS/WASL-interacting protein family member 1-like [Onychomys torridus]|uniref:WAS/WASL-interacting protein family member 1-like n=1 Tax=Onychomys torridus TaxID=38674 RepID=UPI00167FCAC6|nr:WAS/WASL-interacting protein family member 1-like [Onychomys torridus]
MRKPQKGTRPYRNIPYPIPNAPVLTHLIQLTPNFYIQGRNPGDSGAQSQARWAGRWGTGGNEEVTARSPPRREIPKSGSPEVRRPEQLQPDPVRDLSRATSPAPHPGCGCPHPRGFASTGSRNQRGAHTPEGRGGAGAQGLPSGAGRAPGLSSAGCRVSRVPPPPPSASPALGTPRPGPPTPQGRPLPLDRRPRGTRLSRSSTPSVRSRVRTFLYCARAVLGSSGLQRCLESGRNRRQWRGPAGVPLLNPNICRSVGISQTLRYSDRPTSEPAYLSAPV